ncbi:conjugal transfer protein [Marinilactibacillus sp. Marseille-P9653]|uniref:conjugal transfer protein n=1 Tax=Marinilactibacillus sp. Marseille-P9653 TaxID=2866583 RepID=UPI00351D0FAD
MMFFKKNKKNKKVKVKEKKAKQLTINPRKKLVLSLWILLGISFSFAIYKHFTAIDTHTIHENTIVERELRDTNSIENFVCEFVKVYYAWNGNEDELEERQEALENYLPEDLLSLNSIMLDSDITTTSSIRNVQIWSIDQQTDNDFDVTFSVTQRITEETEEDEEETIHTAFEIRVHVDEQGDLVIVNNPTLTTIPSKSLYQPTPLENDNSIDSDTREEIDEFLSSFFTLYPTASQSELSYYIEDNILPAIDREYIFLELIDPVYVQEDENVRATVTVRYQDDITQSNQLSQYDFLLIKNSTWKIIE